MSRFVPGRGATIVFTAGYTQGNAGAPQIFRVPKSASMIVLTLIGSGGGGGNGTLGTGTNRGGGGGGGSGGIARLIVPAISLPSKLWIYVPYGGAAATDGGTTIITAARADVSASPVLDVILASSTIGSFAKKGVNATTTGGAGGAASVIGVVTDVVWPFFGIPTWIAGQAGAAGGTGVTPAAGGAITWGNAGIPISGGAGGGGTSSANATTAGGAITGTGLITTIPGGAAATKGDNGWNFQNTIGHGAIFASSGGAGGGGGGASVGGAGGVGGFGSGGGGGGGGQGTAGVGGKGGDGVCILTWW